MKNNNITKTSARFSYVLLIMIFVCIVFISGCSRDEIELPAGYKTVVSADGVSFTMAYIPGGCTFPTGTNNDGSATVTDGYWIGETEVTYELWHKVRTWARATGYTLDANPGREGHDGTVTAGAGADPTTAKDEPVTTINWREAMVWCNALTEWYNANSGIATGLDCVYYTDSGCITPIRNADDTDSIGSTPGDQDNPYVKVTANGFRLLTSNEWELAARYRNGTLWTYGDHASGDDSGACYNDGSILGGLGMSSVFGNYAVYTGNSGLSTAVVKSKGIGGTNALGLYDMSGNVWEWCFDLSGTTRVMRSGSFENTADTLQTGFRNTSTPYVEYFNVGLRVAKTQ